MVKITHRLKLGEVKFDEMDTKYDRTATKYRI